LDGRFARKCNQCTEFGAVLDMVTDRLATTGLLIILSNIYSEMQFVCISLIFLDISSHWLQMHSQLAIGKRGHKDMRESRFRLLRLYYANRIFMGVCCVSTEVLYLCFFMAKDKELNAIPGLVPISKEIIKRVSFIETFDSFLQKNARRRLFANVRDAIHRSRYSWIFVETNRQYRAIAVRSRCHV
jgi:CDP-diacylglycerol--inositol 3-phosphatidyltransferase